MSPLSQSTAQKNWALASLKGASFDALFSRLEEVPFERGVTIFKPDAEVDFIYFPTSGMISVIGYGEHGGTIESATIGREGMFGGVQALGTGRIRYEHIVQAAGGGVRISLPDFKAAINGDASFRQMHDCNTEAMLDNAVQSLICIGFHSAEARLCRWILMVRDQLGSDTLPLTQEFLAQMLGVQRPSVSLIAHSLQTAGLIQYRRGNITVANPSGLEDASCDCYAIVRDAHHRAFGHRDHV